MKARGSFLEKSLQVDWVLVFSALGLVVVGILMIHSAEAGMNLGYKWRQSVAAMIGFGLLIFAFLFPYQVYRNYARPIYIVMILLLLAVLFAGANLRGTKGWFRLGPVYFQVVELAKIFFILTLGAYLDRRIQWSSPQALFVPFFLAIVPIMLILAQPDLSSSLVFFPVALSMFYLAGARTLHLLSICFVGGIMTGIPLLSTYFNVMHDSLKSHAVLMFFARALDGGAESYWLFSGLCAAVTFVWWFLRKLRIYIPSLYLWMSFLLLLLGSLGAVASDRVMKDYQRKRLIAFVNPNMDPLGGGYNVRQSQIAIGSGQLLGKGYSKGTQSRLGFLPSRHTDFIFSVIGEELGFVRSLFILGLYFLIIWRGFEISMVSRDRYGSLVAAGIAAMFAFYALLNLGMTMGLAPVAGVPIPMLSYGGSSVVSSLIAIGILMSIHWRRHLLDPMHN